MYISTRGNFDKVKASQAIKLGMVPNGGLFVPEIIPEINMEELYQINDNLYQETAKSILKLFLDDYSEEEINECVNNAYNEDNFAHPAMAPVVKLKEGTYILELWYGPTAAFKDMALQIMPCFLSKAIKKVNSEKEVVILVATSGDTGKAALEGFKNVPGIKIIVFFPRDGVSKVQELQMTTTDGNNTYVVAVKGNFDDCQSAVKEIFADSSFKEILENRGYELSSANSINWGRLLPQIVYYFTAYLELVREKEITPGEKVNFIVPTGNFGNILAGWYAKMGLPVNRMICASNENKVLTDFFLTGEYDSNRNFKQTNSPSMDILISSNLERFLFEVTGHDAQKINKWMTDLKTNGKFIIDQETKEAIEETLTGGFATEPETLATIKEVFSTEGYTLDTHTAVAVKVYDEFVQKTSDQTKSIIDSTASPFKFNSSVLEAIKGKEAVLGKDEFTIIEELSKVSGVSVHRALKDLDQKPVCIKQFVKRMKSKRQ